MMACIDLCVDGESVVFPGRLDEKDQIALENLSDLIKAAGLRLKRKQHWLILAPPLSTSNEDLTAALEKLWEVFEKWSPAERDGK